jgi:hypothetical protein
VTALTWAISERPRGKIVPNSSIVRALLCVATNIDVGEVTHIPAVSQRDDPTDDSYEGSEGDGNRRGSSN